MNIQEIHRIFLAHPQVCTDTRNIKPNAIFFALKGGNFNGNTFAMQAIEQGCSYAVVDEETVADERVIRVENVLETLQQLATYHRKYINIPVIGITGSNGKTTTKELVARVLQKRFNTFATFGNLNNHIGVPLSLLSLTKEHEIAVIEMGANHQGEIAMLCTICLPNYGLITNIGKAHLEGFGGEEGVINGKSELYKYIRKSGGLLFINDDDELLKRLSKGIDSYFYGTGSKPNVSGTLKQETPTILFNLKTTNYNIEIGSTLSGKYNFYNIMAAVAIGNYFAVQPEKMKEAIESYESDNNRSQLINTKNNTLFLDAYNANPSSMKAAIENFSSIISSNKIAILGGMNELGETSEQEHNALIELASSKGFEKIILVGNHFNTLKVPANFQKFENADNVAAYLNENKILNATILIKGSRTNQLEKLVSSL